MAAPARKDGYAARAVSDEDLLVDIDDSPRCWRCGRKLAEMLTRAWVIRCGRCKAMNCSPGPKAEAMLARVMGRLKSQRSGR